AAARGLACACTSPHGPFEPRAPGPFACRLSPRGTQRTLITCTRVRDDSLRRDGATYQPLCIAPAPCVGECGVGRFPVHLLCRKTGDRSGPRTRAGLHADRSPDPTRTREPMRSASTLAVTALSAAVIAGGVTLATATSATADPMSGGVDQTSESASNTDQGDGTTGGIDDPDELSSEQVDNARTIIGVGKGAD